MILHALPAEYQVSGRLAHPSRIDPKTAINKSWELSSSNEIYIRRLAARFFCRGGYYPRTLSLGRRFAHLFARHPRPKRNIENRVTVDLHTRGQMSTAVRSHGGTGGIATATATAMAVAVVRRWRHVTKARHVHKAASCAVEAFKVPLAARCR